MLIEKGTTWLSSVPSGVVNEPSDRARTPRIAIRWSSVGLTAT
jgi:hypothetical protein